MTEPPPLTKKEATMPEKEHGQEHFEIREHRLGGGGRVDILTWVGNGNKAGISLNTENLPRLRDEITAYLEANGHS